MDNIRDNKLHDESISTYIVFCVSCYQNFYLDFLLLTEIETEKLLLQS